ncbi:FecR domain-containing protein [Paraburkholderia edwinii]|jgi:hypothetical protein|uniref:FecR domain-containing protein n=1 Tax=Paraburkholderia edwinii TaxID=2861782 RepID=A0ABX8UXH4_9BURK|nr:FecR domain-containing protein [Paraburkholderia edwinii]
MKLPPLAITPAHAALLLNRCTPVDVFVPFAFCRTSLCLAAALGLLSGPASAQDAGTRTASATVTYVTQSGDSLYDIASRYLRDPRDWAALRSLNRVKASRRLQPGIELRLPVALLKKEPQSARIVATNGPAEHAYRENVFTPVSVGMTLGEGDRLRTGNNGFVTLELEDGSHLSLPQDSLIEIGTLRRTALTGAKDRVILLRRGEVDSEVTHATQPADRFQIRSPSVVAGVRGTRFRVNYDNDNRSTAVEVLDGAVGVDAALALGGNIAPPGQPLQASAQLIRAKFGNVTDASGRVGVPVELLASPELANPGKVQDGKDVAFDLLPDLLPSGGARAYRVQIARDADLLDLMRDQRVRVPHTTFSDVPDGTYFVRVSAIDENGLEGLPQIYAFERRRLGITTSARRLGSREFEFRWLADRAHVATRYRFVLASTPDLRNPIVDRTDLKNAEIVVSDLQPGLYYWTIVVEQFENGRFYQKSSAIRSFQLAR